MKRKALVIVLITSIFINLYAQTAFAGIKFPDVEKLASGIADTAGKAGEAISGAAQQAGETVSGAAQQAGEVISGAASQAGKFAAEAGSSIGKAASDAADQVSDITSGFASQAGAVVSEWGKYAGETADEVKELLSEAGVKVMVSAADLGNATADKVSALTDQAGKTANDALKAVADAGNMVVDQAGHVVDLAAAGADYVSSSAGKALLVLQKKGTILMDAAGKAVAGIDLSDPDSWDQAREAINYAIEEVLEEKNVSLGIVEIDDETLEVLTSIIFGTLMYGYQYSEGEITLGEYAACMSEVIIREGLPTGVGVIVDLLPLPYGKDKIKGLSKGVTLYLVSLAYNDKTGEEIQAEEELLLEEAAAEEMITEEATEGITE